MEFHESVPIYLQIADIMCGNILSGMWKPGQRIPSIRETAESIEVNPNTVMRTYGYMEDRGIIHNQRGIGFFLSDDADRTTRELMRKTFIERDLPRLARSMDLLGLTIRDLEQMFATRRAGKTREEQQ